MNIFLTGEINTGKSTTIKEFLKDYKGSLGGFITIRRKMDIDDYSGIYLLDINRQDQPLDILNRAGTCNEERKPICHRDVFETIGASSLSFNEPPSLIIMDELGVLEENCERFKRKVIESLDSSVNVLGAIKKKSSDFLDSIRARKDVIILDVRKISKNEILNKLKEYLY